MNSNNIKKNKSNKKGFTLVELLVTIGIVGIILTISVVSVVSIINKSRENSDKIAINNIKASAEVYVKEYALDVSWEKESDTTYKTCVPIQTLISKGYIKKDILEGKNNSLSISLKKDEYGTIISKEVSTTDCYTYSNSVSIPKSEDICNNFSYDGNSRSLISSSIIMNNYKKVYYQDTNYSNENNIHPINAGEYKVSVELVDGKQWTDGTTEVKTVTCKIKKATPTLTLSSMGNSATEEELGTKEITLNSDVSGTVTIKSSNNNYVTAKVKDDENIIAGNDKILQITTLASRSSTTVVTITVTPTGEDAKNYEETNIVYTVGNIKKKEASEPSCNTLYYNGSTQALVKADDSYQLLNNNAIDIGTYTVTAVLKYGYIWKNKQTTDNLVLDCEIKVPTPTVTYKNATCNPASFSVTYGKTYGESQSLCTPTKTGYTFAGWYSDSSLTQQVTNDTIVTNFNNHDLYAKWIANTYTVTYYNGSTKLGTSTHTYDTAKVLTTWSSLGGTVTNSSYGWSFYGWSTSNANTTRTYTDGKSVTSLVSTNGGNVNLYALYKRTVSFKHGVSSGTSSTATQYWNPYGTANGTHISGVTSPSLTAITNWSALGFRNDTTASSKEYTAGGTIYPAVAGAKTLYGVYSRTLTIKYSGNGSTSGSVANTTKTVYLNSNSTTTSSQAVTLAANGFDKGSCYYFSKWAAGSTSGTQYSAGASYNPSLAYNASTFGTTMYAIWGTYKYTVSFNANGGSVSTSSKSVTYCSTYGTLPTPTRTNYTFLGWYTASSGGTKITSSSTVSTKSNHTLYAQWKISDATAPTITRTDVDCRTGWGGGNTFFNVTYSFSDTGTGVYGYYWGTTYPNATNVTYTTTTASSVTVQLAAGTYYFGVKDKAGNVAVATFKGLIYAQVSEGTTVSVSGYNYMLFNENNWSFYTLKNASTGATIASFRGNNGSGVLNVGSITSVKWTATDDTTKTENGDTLHIGMWN